MAAARDWLARHCRRRAETTFDFKAFVSEPRRIWKDIGAAHPAGYRITVQLVLYN
jgi:hypothetical protein